MSTQPKLLDRVRDKLRSKQYSPRTEQAYIHWIKRGMYDREIVRAGDGESGR